MYTLFLAGGIGSGKSTVADLLVRHGAWRCDLDQISRDVCEPGSDVLTAIADEFGSDVIDSDTGELDRALLAGRAFASPEATAALEAIEHPAIKDALASILTNTSCAAIMPEVTVVEVPLLDRMLDMLSLADEVMVVTCPMDLRRERVRRRGTSEVDFERRVSLQPTDDCLCPHADTVIVNDGDVASLATKVDAWWRKRELAGWVGPRTGGADA